MVDDISAGQPLSPQLAEKFQLIQSLLPNLRSRAVTVRRTAFDAALTRYRDLERAEEELEYIIDVCDGVERA